MRVALLEKAYAQTRGFFWLPCPCCGEEFGGHEWREVNGLPMSVPVLDQPGMSSGICPECTKAGYGYPYEVSNELWGRSLRIVTEEWIDSQGNHVGVVIEGPELEDDDAGS